MGQPDFYASELPQRCLQLLDELWSPASEVRQKDRPDLGPLTSTFLLSMSIPIVNLPIERIERQRDGQGYANERELRPGVTREIDRVFRGRLDSAPFFSVEDGWSYFYLEQEPPPNLAHDFPDGLAESLDRDDAKDAVSGMPVSEWSAVLRNALAHGGIAYLDADGRSTYGRPVKMYAFFSGRYEENPDNPKRPKLVGVKVLRIHSYGYRRFLEKWVEWLVESGIERAASAA